MQLFGHALFKMRFEGYGVSLYKSNLTDALNVLVPGFSILATHGHCHGKVFRLSTLDSIDSSQPV